MDKVTAEQIRAALPAGINAWWPIRNCSMCSAPIGYDFTASGDVFFKSACFCTDLGGYDLRDLENVVDLFNRQTPEIRAGMWDEFEKAISSGG